MTNNNLLDMIKQERARRQSGPAACIVFSWADLSDEDFEREVAEQRRSGQIGPSTRVIEYGG